MDTPYNGATGRLEPFAFPTISATVAGLRAWRAERRKIAEITRELDTYSNSDLADLGLKRSDIPDVARGRLRRA
jgi:uncharacterized protein YjiS (DUF1127 family)